MSKKYDKEFTEILADLNAVLKCRFRDTETNRKRVVKWLDKGYKLEDFKKVHRHKFAEWNGTELQKFLTPATLYANCHFEDYLEASENVDLTVKSNLKGTYVEDGQDVGF